MGHIEDRRDQGRGWRARYRGPDHRERSRTFKRRIDAERFLVSVEASLMDGTWVDPALGKVSFDEFSRAVFSSRMNLRPSTRTRDETYLRRHVLPRFGNVPVKLIRRSDVQDWVKSLSEDKGLAPRTVRECYRILGGIMREAALERLISESPCHRISLPRINHVERRFLRASEVELLAQAMDDRYAPIVYVGAYLGLRWGEIAGLKRKHADFLRRRVQIVGSLERDGNRVRYVEETKTINSRRSVPVPQFLIDKLAHHLTGARDSEFVFTAPEGGLLLYHGWRSRFWTPAVKRSQLGHVTPHELRHTAAALWIDQGANPVTVQRRLGHKDVRTTLQLYGHLFPEQDDLLTERMEHLYRQCAAAPPRPEDTSDAGIVSGKNL